MAYLFQVKDETRKPFGKWRFQFTDWQGKRRTITGTYSKSETEKIAIRLEAEHDLIKKGHRPAPKPEERYRNKPFVEMMEEYLAWGKSQGGLRGRPWSITHAKNKETKLEFWRLRLRLEILSDILDCLPRVEKALQELQEEGKTGSTLTKYAEALKGFIAWCIKHRYIKENPLQGLSTFDKTPDYVRAALTPDEVKSLLSASPYHRALLYKLAILSGLRANELKALTPNDLAENGLWLRAEWTKNRKSGFQPLPLSVVKELKAFSSSDNAKRLYETNRRKSNKKSLPPKNPLVYVPSHTSREIKKDLKQAGIPLWKVGQGKVDFHSLRATFITLANGLGACAKELQTLARHSDANLTLNTYTRVEHSRLTL